MFRAFFVAAAIAALFVPAIRQEQKADDNSIKSKRETVSELFRDVSQLESSLEALLGDVKRLKRRIKILHLYQQIDDAKLLYQRTTLTKVGYEKLVKELRTEIAKISGSVDEKKVSGGKK